MQVLRITITIFVITVLFGCVTATGSVIITGQVMPAVDPKEVKIYLNPPLQYETIGLVEASCEKDLSAQKTQDMIIDELKKQAAKIGANGIILANIEDRSSGGVIVYGVFVPSVTRTARGEAIYIIQE